MSDAAVRFEGVGLTIAGGRALLREVSLAVETGTTTALLGRSGSGKTTLLRTVNGLVMPSVGVVRTLGRSTAEWDPLQLRRRIGYVIQETGLFPHMTVERNASLALELAGRPMAERRQRAREVLRLAGLDESLAGRTPWQLSGGQRQRVGLARAMAAEPEILLMDEPFGALDPMTRAEMQTMLREMLARVGAEGKGKTVLLVTHDLDEALYLADRVVFLEEGCVVADLAVGEVLGSANEHVRRYVAAVHRAVPRAAPEVQAGSHAVTGSGPA